MREFETPFALERFVPKVLAWSHLKHSGRLPPPLTPQQLSRERKSRRDRLYKDRRYAASERAAEWWNVSKLGFALLNVAKFASARQRGPLLDEAEAIFQQDWAQGWNALLALQVCGRSYMDNAMASETEEEWRRCLDAGEVQYRRAVELGIDPARMQSSWALDLSVVSLTAPSHERRGLLERAIVLLEEALDLDPISFQIPYSLGFAYWGLAMLLPEGERRPAYVGAAHGLRRLGNLASLSRREPEPEDKAWLLTLRGNLALRVARLSPVGERAEWYREAEAVLREAAKGEPPFVIQRYARLTRVDEIEIERAGLTKPFRAAYDLACLFALTDRPKECEAWLRTAQELGVLPAYYRDDADLAAVREAPWFDGLREKA